MFSHAEGLKNNQLDEMNAPCILDECGYTSTCNIMEEAQE